MRDDFRDVTARLYAVVSAPPGERDWQSTKDLFHPAARLVRTGIDDDGQPFALCISHDEYIANASTRLAQSTFSERELSQRATIFGNVANVASVYEFEWRSGADVRRGRGVNFFTLVRDAGHWRIMSIVWDTERDGVSLAASGLQS